MSRIGRLRATVAVPDRGDLPAGTLDRVHAAVTDRIPAALGRRFPQARSDGGPVVVIRRLQVSAAVPATAGADEIAERLADRLARAITSAPGEVRAHYPCRAAHIAAFTAALSGGTGDSWVFDSFAGARLLAPLTALRTLARRYTVPVTAVLAELARAETLVPVITRASPAELARTWAACSAAPHARLTAADAARQLDRWEPAGAGLAVGAPADAVALILTGRAIRSGAPAGLAVGVATAIVASRSEPLRAGRSVAAGEQPAAAPPPSDPGPAREPGAFAADGAPVFLLLPSFAAVGLGELAPAQRADVLAAATRTAPTDPAISLAAGPDDQREPADITATVQRALLHDDRLGLERLELHPAGGHLVVRDATSRIWLAVVDPEAPLEPALIPAVRAVPRTVAEPDDADRARLAADLSYLLPDPPDPDAGRDDLGARRASAVAARAGLGHFARRLPGFAASSLPYLSDRFLPPGGVVVDLGAALLVRLPSPPLLVVLALAGLDTTTVQVPWLPYPVTVMHEDTG